MIRAFIFDYFDVIRPAGTGVRPTYRRLGGDVTKDEVFLADVTTAANLGFIQDQDEQIAERLSVPVETWRAALRGSPVNDPDLLAYIEELRTKGYKTGLLSNAGAGALGEFFTSEELLRYFDYAATSGDIGLAKPEAAAYRQMVEKLGVEPSTCVMVDDRKEFCLGAERIGMQSIQYRHFDQFREASDQLLRANQF